MFVQVPNLVVFVDGAQNNCSIFVQYFGALQLTERLFLCYNIGTEAGTGVLVGRRGSVQTTLARIMEEYERIAFGEDEDIKIADRLRALEQLRLLLSAGREDGGAPTLEIRVEYV